MTEPTPPTFLAAIGGDPRAASELRARLAEARRTLAADGASAALLRDLDAAITGSLPVRSLMVHDAFRDLVTGGMRRVADEWESLAPDDRAAAVRRSRAAAGSAADDPSPR